MSFHERLISKSRFNALVEKHATAIYRKHEWNPRWVAAIFNIPFESVEEEFVDYFKAYASAAIRQLVSAFFTYRGDLSLEEREAQLVGSATKFETDSEQERNTVLFIGNQSLLQHEINHTIVSLALQKNKTDPSSLTPLFQKTGPHLMSRIPKNLVFNNRSRVIQDRLDVDERLVQMLDIPADTRWAMKNNNHSLHDFMKRYNLYGGKKNPGYPMAAALFTRDTENPYLFRDFFIKTTFPFMRRHAPKEGQALSEKEITLR